MPNHTSKNILIAPLDWGAGHTTRCMPIVSHLIDMGHTPIVAGNKGQISIYEEAFEDKVQTVHLDGYKITYSQWNRFAQLGVLSQLPRIMGVIKQEHSWLTKIVDQYEIDGVISDNRYGLYHPSVSTVIITHQLQVLSGMGAIANNILRWLHYNLLGKFGSTWIADSAGSASLAGKLSHPSALPLHHQYIGLLSRFAGMPQNNAAVKKEHLLVLLSGPEPQRSALSALLWKQILRYDGKVIFAEGSDDAIAPSHIPPNVTYTKRLGNQELQLALAGAHMVICRSGYSTIMDLIATCNNALLIPTPGQTEQEYLAKELHNKGVFYSASQYGFDLQAALNAASNYTKKHTMTPNTFGEYKPVLQSWLGSL